MLDIYIFQPASDLSDPVISLIDGKAKAFSSRLAAMLDAVQACRDAKCDGAPDPATIHLQGTDGQWRAFDGCLLPIPAVDAVSPYAWSPCPPPQKIRPTAPLT